MSDWRPVLRGDLERPAADVLYDPLLDRHVNMGPVSSALVDRLDGTRTLAALLDEVGAARPDVARAAVEHSFRSLMLMLVVDGAGVETRERVRVVRSGSAALPLLALEDARFSCQGSSSCCRSYAYGPLAPSDLERIDALDLTSVFPHITEKGSWHVTREATRRLNTTGEFLVNDKGACTFLLDDGRCGLHAHFGAAAKPALCQLYPFSYRLTIEGCKIYDFGECSSYSTATRVGEPHAAQIERLRKLIEVMGVPPLRHPVVFVDAQTPCDFGAVLALQTSLRQLVLAQTATHDTTATVVAIGGACQRFVAAVASCPLAPGEPDATIAAVLAAPPAPPVAAASWDALVTVAEALFSALAAQAGGELRVDGFLSAEYVREMLATLIAIRTLAAGRRGDAPSEATTVCERAAGVRLPIEADAMWRHSLRQLLFSDGLVCSDRLRAGALALAFRYLTGVIGAKLSAATGGRTTAAASDLDRGHVGAMRLLDRKEAKETLVAHEELAWAVFATLPWLVPSQPADAAPAIRRR